MSRYRKDMNLGENPREVEITIKLTVNGSYDKDELANIQKKIKNAIYDLELAFGFRVESVGVIPFVPFEFKIGGETVICKGDKTKIEDEYLRKGSK